MNILPDCVFKQSRTFMSNGKKDQNFYLNAVQSQDWTTGELCLCMHHTEILFLLCKFSVSTTVSDL